ncbi:MAG: hypothetical protein N3Z29_10265 [Synechococcaceae cyanobacterium MAG-AL1]|nr:hypothetical protein [Candidatus Regnicoccus frigidus MAG-AL1]
MSDNPGTTSNKTDLAVALTKGVLAAIPFVGGLAAEVVSTLIPNQRVDRISALLTSLASKVSAMEQERVKARFHEPGFVDLLEDGMYQASRALSEERMENISSLLKNGLSDDDVESIRYKTLMSLLGELNDAEVIILRGHAKLFARDEEFHEQHKDVLHPESAHLGSDQQQLDRNALDQEYRNHLVRLGLLKNRFARPRRGELPEFDEKTGLMKASGREITTLGRLLLRRLDLLEDDEY